MPYVYPRILPRQIVMNYVASMRASCVKIVWFGLLLWFKDVIDIIKICVLLIQWVWRLVTWQGSVPQSISLYMKHNISQIPTRIYNDLCHSIYLIKSFFSHSWIFFSNLTIRGESTIRLCDKRGVWENVGVLCWCIYFWANTLR